jgi:ribosomal protein L32
LPGVLCGLCGMGKGKTKTKTTTKNINVCQNCGHHF